MKLKLILVCTLFNLIGASLVLTGFTNQPIEEAQVKPAIIIEYQNDYCSVDNIGLVRLTLKDIERIVE